MVHRYLGMLFPSINAWVSHQLNFVLPLESNWQQQGQQLPAASQQNSLVAPSVELSSVPLPPGTEPGEFIHNGASRSCHTAQCDELYQNVGVDNNNIYSRERNCENVEYRRDKYDVRRRPHQRSYQNNTDMNLNQQQNQSNNGPRDKPNTSLIINNSSKDLSSNMFPPTTSNLPENLQQNDKGSSPKCDTASTRSSSTLVSIPIDFDLFDTIDTTKTYLTNDLNENNSDVSSHRSIMIELSAALLEKKKQYAQMRLDHDKVSRPNQEVSPEKDPRSKGKKIKNEGSKVMKTRPFKDNVSKNEKLTAKFETTTTKEVSKDNKRSIEDVSKVVLSDAELSQMSTRPMYVLLEDYKKIKITETTDSPELNLKPVTLDTKKVKKLKTFSDPKELHLVPFANKILELFGSCSDSSGDEETKTNDKVPYKKPDDKEHKKGKRERSNTPHRRQSVEDIRKQSKPKKRRLTLASDCEDMKKLHESQSKSNRQTKIGEPVDEYRKKDKHKQKVDTSLLDDNITKNKTKSDKIRETLKKFVKISKPKKSPKREKKNEYKTNQSTSNKKHCSELNTCVERTTLGLMADNNFLFADLKNNNENVSHCESKENKTEKCSKNIQESEKKKIKSVKIYKNNNETIKETKSTTQVKPIETNEQQKNYKEQNIPKVQDEYLKQNYFTDLNDEEIVVKGQGNDKIKISLKEQNLPPQILFEDKEDTTQNQINSEYQKISKKLNAKYKFSNEHNKLERSKEQISLDGAENNKEKKYLKDQEITERQINSEDQENNRKQIILNDQKNNRKQIISEDQKNNREQINLEDQYDNKKQMDSEDKKNYEKTNNLENHKNNGEQIYLKDLRSNKKTITSEDHKIIMEQTYLKVQEDNKKQIQKENKINNEDQINLKEQCTSKKQHNLEKGQDKTEEQAKSNELNYEDEIIFESQHKVKETNVLKKKYSRETIDLEIHIDTDVASNEQEQIDLEFYTDTDGECDKEEHIDIIFKELEVSEGITLYRSDQTIIDDLDVQATVASVIPSVLEKNPMQAESSLPELKPIMEDFIELVDSKKTPSITFNYPVNDIIEIADSPETLSIPSNELLNNFIEIAYSPETSSITSNKPVLTASTYEMKFNGIIVTVPKLYSNENYATEDSNENYATEDNAVDNTALNLSSADQENNLRKKSLTVETPTSEREARIHEESVSVLQEQSAIPVSNAEYSKEELSLRNILQVQGPIPNLPLRQSPSVPAINPSQIVQAPPKSLVAPLVENQVKDSAKILHAPIWNPHSHIREQSSQGNTPASTLSPQPIVALMPPPTTNQIPRKNSDTALINKPSNEILTGQSELIYQLVPINQNTPNVSNQNTTTSSPKRSKKKVGGRTAPNFQNISVANSVQGQTSHLWNTLGGGLVNTLPIVTSSFVQGKSNVDSQNTNSQLQISSGISSSTPFYSNINVANLPIQAQTYRPQNPNAPLGGPPNHTYIQNLQNLVNKRLPTHFQNLNALAVHDRDRCFENCPCARGPPPAYPLRNDFDLQNQSAGFGHHPLYGCSPNDQALKMPLMRNVNELELNHLLKAICTYAVLFNGLNIHFIEREAYLNQYGSLCVPELLKQERESFRFDTQIKLLKVSADFVNYAKSGMDCGSIISADRIKWVLEAAKEHLAAFMPNVTLSYFYYTMKDLMNPRIDKISDVPTLKRIYDYIIVTTERITQVAEGQKAPARKSSGRKPAMRRPIYDSVTPPAAVPQKAALTTRQFAQLRTQITRYNTLCETNKKLMADICVRKLDNSAKQSKNWPVMPRNPIDIISHTIHYVGKPQQPSAGAQGSALTPPGRCTLTSTTAPERDDFRIRLPLTQPYDTPTDSPSFTCSSRTSINTEEGARTPVYAPTPTISRPICSPSPSSDSSFLINVAVVDTVKNEPAMDLTEQEIETIDLTWVEDLDPETLKNEMKWFVKKEELNKLESEETEVEDLQEDHSNSTPVSKSSPTDSGFSSPNIGIEYNELIFADRTCICGESAEYICGCMMAMYCSEPCQLKDWPEHKETCLKNKNSRDQVQK